MNDELGYRDLPDPQKVYEALLGYGMFADKLPPCFDSSFLLELDTKAQQKSHASLQYNASRNTNTSRQFAIPHPESYIKLCRIIKLNWKDINEHIGKPQTKFNYCHVRKLKNKNHIFEMNYEGFDKWEKENQIQDYFLGRTHVVKADISTCFPSIYTHSIPWAIQGKPLGKKNRKTTDKNGNGHWSNDLDRESRYCNDQQSSGLPIGPHTSNIISEIILTQVDLRLQKKGFKKVIRYIDDYTYFAKNEEDARKFLKTLELSLKEYELLLNPKKTKIISLIDYFDDQWPQKLARFSFPEKNEIGFTTINAYFNLAISLAKETNNYATLSIMQ